MNYLLMFCRPHHNFIYINGYLLNCTILLYFLKFSLFLVNVTGDGQTYCGFLLYLSYMEYFPSTKVTVIACIGLVPHAFHDNQSGEEGPPSFNSNYRKQNETL